jgi:hypothetical protein
LCKQLGLGENSELFSAYREYPGMIEHIAKTIISNTNESEGLFYGKMFRQLVRDIMFGNPISIDG